MKNFFERSFVLLACLAMSGQICLAPTVDEIRANLAALRLNSGLAVAAQADLVASQGGNLDKDPKLDALIRRHSVLEDRIGQAGEKKGFFSGLLSTEESRLEGDAKEISDFMSKPIGDVSKNPALEGVDAKKVNAAKQRAKDFTLAHRAIQGLSLETFKVGEGFVPGLSRPTARFSDDAIGRVAEGFGGVDRPEQAIRDVARHQMPRSRNDLYLGNNLMVGDHMAEGAGIRIGNKVRDNRWRAAQGRQGQQPAGRPRRP